MHNCVSGLPVAPPGKRDRSSRLSTDTPSNAAEVASENDSTDRSLSGPVCDAAPLGGGATKILKELCPEAMASYESIIGWIHSRRLRMSQKDSTLLTVEVSALLSSLASVVRENQQLRAGMLVPKGTTPKQGVIKTRRMPSGRLTALAPSQNPADFNKTGPQPCRLPRRESVRGGTNVTKSGPLSRRCQPSNASYGKSTDLNDADLSPRVVLVDLFKGGPQPAGERLGKGKPPGPEVEYHPSNAFCGKPSVMDEAVVGTADERDEYTPGKTPSVEVEYHSNAFGGKPLMMDEAVARTADERVEYTQGKHSARSKKFAPSRKYHKKAARERPCHGVEYRNSNIRGNPPSGGDYPPSVTRSYANVLKTRANGASLSSRRGTGQGANPVLLVYPAERFLARLSSPVTESGVSVQAPSSESWDSERVRELVTKSVSPLDLGIQVVDMQPIRHGGVAIELGSTAHVATLRQAIESCPATKDRVTLRDRKSVKPRVIVYDVPSDVAASELVRALWAKIDDKQEAVAPVKPLFHLASARSADQVHWVLAVEPPAFNKVVEGGKLPFNWGVLNIREYHGVTRCYRCHQFGHTSKYCTQAQICAKCTGQHDHVGCTNAFRCASCVTANTLYGKKFSTDHPATARSCPARVWELARLRNQISYG